jgi:hypothetical protein
VRRGPADDRGREPGGALRARPGRRGFRGWSTSTGPIPTSRTSSRAARAPGAWTSWTATVIVAIDGVSTLSAPDAAALLRNKAGRQVLLAVKSKGAAAKDVVACPITLEQDGDLRYDEWEKSTRGASGSRSAGAGRSATSTCGAMNRTNVSRVVPGVLPGGRAPRAHRGRSRTTAAATSTAGSSRS